MVDIEKHVETVEEQHVRYVDADFADGSFEATVTDQAVTVQVRTIDGDTIIRVPQVHLSRVVAMLTHIETDQEGS